jgi:hypothetical protein
MDQQLVKPRKIVSRGVIIFAIVALSPLILWGLLSIPAQIDFFRLKAEISRVTSASGVKPISIECETGGIDTLNRCTANYVYLTLDQQSQMFTKSGYKIFSNSNIGFNYIAANYPKDHVEATGGSGDGSKTSITFDFNDYNN